MLVRAMREAIEDDHRRIEETPLSQALMGASVSPNMYRCLLQQMLPIHRVVERASEGHRLYSPTMARCASIRRDIDRLGQIEGPDRLLQETSAVVSMLEAMMGACPWAFVGPIYVLEGSRMGSRLIIGPLAQALRRPPELGQGLDYHLENAEEAPRRFRAWKRSLDEAVIEPNDRAAAIDAAGALMHALVEIYQSIPEACRVATPR